MIEKHPKGFKNLWGVNALMRPSFLNKLTDQTSAMVRCALVTLDLVLCVLEQKKYYY